MRDIFQDLGWLAYPAVTAGEPSAVGAPEDAVADIADGLESSRRAHVENLRLAWENDDGFDPLLAEIARARADMVAAEWRLRELLAYGREFVGPRPYRLEDLARAAGMSISGIRTAYDEDEITTVAAVTGAKPRRATEGGAR